MIIDDERIPLNCAINEIGSGGYLPDLPVGHEDKRTEDGCYMFFF